MLRSRQGEKLLVEGRLSGRVRVRMDGEPERELGVPIVEAVIPMLARVGIKVKIKPVEGTVLAEVARKGDFQPISGPTPLVPILCDDEMFSLQDAAKRLQYYALYNNPRSTSCSMTRRHNRHGQAQRVGEAGQPHRLRGRAGLVLQLQQGRDGLPSLGEGAAAQRDRAGCPDVREHLDRCDISGGELSPIIDFPGGCIPRCGRRGDCRHAALSRPTPDPDGAILLAVAAVIFILFSVIPAPLPPRSAMMARR